MWRGEEKFRNSVVGYSGVLTKVFCKHDIANTAATSRSLSLGSNLKTQASQTWKRANRLALAFQQVPTFLFYFFFISSKKLEKSTPIIFQVVLPTLGCSVF